jgi:hypothetical protein
MSDMKVDSALSSAGVDREEFDQKAQEVEQSQDIQAEIDKLSNDKDGFTQDDRNKVGEMVADKAIEKLGGNFDGLNDTQKMALAEYCGNCLDTDANAAADEAVRETESAT